MSRISSPPSCRTRWAADVCGFVGRRLAGSAVKLLVAIRADIASRFDTAALPESPVAPLSADGAARLLDRRHPTLGRQVRQVVLDQAQGNPLALIELPAHAEAAPEDLLERHGIPLPRRLHHVYGARIAMLDDAVRAELLLGALDGTPAGRYRMTDVCWSWSRPRCTPAARSRRASTRSPLATPGCRRSRPDWPYSHTARWR